MFEMFKKKKKDNFYFDSFTAQARFSAQIAKRTGELLRDFKYEEVKDNLIDLHGIEHAADQKQHEIMERLSREFIAPLEREDIVLMAQQLDDLTDRIEDIMVTFYQFDIHTVDGITLKYIDMIEKAIDMLLQLLGKFENFKKDTTLSEHIIEINRLEEDGDRIYREAMHNLFAHENDARVLISTKSLYNCLEDVMDDIEDLSNQVETIIMKNS